MVEPKWHAIPLRLRLGLLPPPSSLLRKGGVGWGSFLHLGLGTFLPDKKGGLLLLELDMEEIFYLI